MLTRKALRALLMFAAFATFTAATTYAIHYRAQPLIDLYNFRQTQTALTSYWMIQDGWRLAYETPIGGAPWSIPFEFPIYQTIVAGISWAFHLPLDPVGRLVTFAFLVACVIPARQLQSRLRLPSETFWVFCCLFFSAPIYVYWGRTFMIETAAMFFTFASLPYFVDLLHGTRKAKAAFFFALWTSLSLLQKVTTGLPVVGILGLIWVTNTWRAARSPQQTSLKRLWTDVIAFAVPLALGYSWTEYSSQVRIQNTLGAYLTNSKLSTWNWGTFQQRLSEKFWVEVLWQRLFERNLAGVVGLTVILAALLLKRLGVRRDVMLICVLLGLLPFFAFTNLYIIHDYYPTACVIFLVAALAVALGRWAAGGTLVRTISLVLLAVFVGNGIYQFRTVYRSEARYRERVPHIQELMLAQTLKASTDKEAALVLYGFDWSSQMAYFSQRRTFTVPVWPGKLTEIWADPQRFLGSTALGAIAVCNNTERPTPGQIADRFLAHDGFYGGRLGTCTVLVKDNPATNALAVIKEDSPIPDLGDCRAHVESITGFPADDTAKLTRIAVAEGWTSGQDSQQKGPTTLVALTNNGVIARAAKIIITPPFGSGKMPQGFSGMIDTTGLIGTYDVVVLSERDAEFKRCSLDKPEQIALPAIADAPVE